MKSFIIENSIMAKVALETGQLFLFPYLIPFKLSQIQHRSVITNTDYQASRIFTCIVPREEKTLTTNLYSGNLDYYLF